MSTFVVAQVFMEPPLVVGPFTTEQTAEEWAADWVKVASMATGAWTVEITPPFVPTTTRRAVDR